ncbi:hypothetical protein SACE_5890 [Saccharopolyspora erythraea NRRL 2338]|uniref:Uncharacterized protein n=1 Tax=Saccharopolyspora erythraea (strain ATCC 11635 / DSM 40517 / JCM 4748 / NBRC 13426 / NCIMB 8594 / NRRL 2338) TaxID=405948 RepID=A4FLZ8_SACEN|nr:hypothetical protein N599_00515 [Saccharopolyspora erythraea D]CAM05073.1 hypothetical protein SACE_5890 [Saccharopolyspora erythraea NRRL 2338]
MGHGEPDDERGAQLPQRRCQQHREGLRQELREGFGSHPEQRLRQGFTWWRVLEGR